MNNSDPLTKNNQLAYNFLKANERLHTVQRIFFTTHARTDGDDLGAMLALYHLFKQAGKDVAIGAKAGMPPQLGFLPGSQAVLDSYPTHFKPDIVVVSGCSTLSRTELPELEIQGLEIINFDHHPDNEYYGNINVVDSTVSSVAELVYQFLKTTKQSISADMATCLLTGIITDTGSFLHSNTQTSTLKAASELARRGARSALITKHTFRGKNTAALQAWGRALHNTWVDAEKKMVCTVMTAEDLADMGHPPLSVFEGLVETINKVPDAAWALFLKQDGDIVKGSMRSDPHKLHGGFDVGSLAKLFGGGGHRFSAGFVIPGKLRRLPNNQWQIEPLSP